MKSSDSAGRTLVAIAGMGLAATLVAVTISPTAGLVVVAALQAIAACARALAGSRSKDG